VPGGHGKSSINMPYRVSDMRGSQLINYGLFVTSAIASRRATPTGDRAPAANRSERGTGSLRERSPGVWEVRVVAGFGPARGRSIQRSFTVHGDAALAGTARRELVAGYGSTRGGVRHAASVVSVGELLEGYLGSD
jgi:hypothetical protein